jgi:hypothetical protein
MVPPDPDVHAVVDALELLLEVEEVAQGQQLVDLRGRGQVGRVVRVPGGVVGRARAALLLGQGVDRPTGQWVGLAAGLSDAVGDREAHLVRPGGRPVPPRQGHRRLEILE